MSGDDVDQRSQHAIADEIGLHEGDIAHLLEDTFAGQKAQAPSTEGRVPS